ADLANYLQIPSDFSLEEISFTDHETYLNAVQNLHQEQIDKFTDYITALGLDRNPSLRISHISRNISKKILLMAGGRFLPSLNLSYSRNWEKYDYQSDYEDSERLMLTAAIPIFPLLDNYSALSKARHDHKRSQYDLDAAEDGIKLALKSAVLNLITSAKSVYAARIALDYARETYEQMEERFRSNLLSTSELLDIELLLTSAENQYIISLFDFLRAKSTLQQQTGIEDEQLIFNTKIFDKGEK
ncbi:MAG: TolC family protein, partial [Candidatus Cloacimonetes bacterium]|nr:TolC family protein [Candidatus Cloacimonadota bacterium]